MVAGDDHELLAGERLPDVLEERARRRQRVAHRPVAQLEDVSQENHALGIGDGVEQCGAQLGAAQQVGVRDAPEMQVRDDQRAHR